MHVISLLTAHDLTAAFFIEKASHVFPWMERIFNSNRGKRYLNLKLTLEDTLVVFAITQVVLDKATLFNIVVHPSYQRHGHSRRLLEQLIETLAASGIIMLWLEVRASNAIAVSLYKQLGFNEVSLQHDYCPAINGCKDAMLMALTL
ncbi:MAG: ribosomal protein S18-alanine N-acetyltransferase [Candidatus Malihini olakiniferum]